MTAMTDDTLPITPRTIRDEMIAFGIMTALLLIVPFTGVYPFFVMQALCFALLACAFNLLIGYGGLLSFGHAMFLGTAGYVTAHALKVWGLTPELGIVVGTAAAAGLGVITGLVAIRRQGIYFAMITLALVAAAVFHLSADAVHPWRRRHPGHSAGTLVRDFQSRQADGALLRHRRRFPVRVPDDFPHHQFAVRRGAEIDPGKRAAGDLARLQDRSVQAARLYPVRNAGGICRLA